MTLGTPTTLEVELEVRGTDTVRQRFTDERGRELLRRRAGLSDLLELRLAERVQLRPGELDAALGGSLGLRLGTALAQWLFGGVSDQARLFADLFGLPGQRRASPRLGPVDLRIRTTSAALLAQPWMLLSWEQLSLLAEGWRIRVHTDPRDPEDATLAWPPSILLLLSDAGSPPTGARRHERELHSLFEELGLGRGVRVVSDLPGMEQAIAEQTWDIIYVYGHGTVDNDQPALVLLDDLDGEVSVPLGDLRPLVRKASPSLLYLSACMAGAGGWLSAGHVFGDVAEVVLSHHSVIGVYSARRRALRVLGAVLRDGADPIEAFCTVPELAEGARLEWMCGSAFSRVTRLAESPQRTATTGPDSLWAWRVDRRPQKAEVEYRLGGSQQAPGIAVRAHTVLGAGPLRSGVAPEAEAQPHLGTVLTDHVEAARHTLVVPLPVEAPDVPDLSPGSPVWDDVLREALGAPRRGTLATAFDRFLERQHVSPEQPGIVWFDCGAFVWQPPGRVPPFKLMAWARQCVRWAQALEDRRSPTHVVFYLGLECADGLRERLEAGLSSFDRELNPPGVKTLLLPKTSPVPTADLREFLWQQVVGVDPDFLADLADAIVTNHGEGGRVPYRAAVDALNQGQRLGCWQALHDQLAGPTATDDFDF